MLRQILQSSLFVFAAFLPVTAAAADVSGAVQVVTVSSTRVADLVVLSHGFDAGLRQGMLCRVSRAGKDISEILLVDIRPNCSSALIVGQMPGQSIRSGDTASVKVLKT